MIEDQVAQLRREYEAMGLSEGDMAADPITEFRSWFDGILDAGLEEPNAFVLATADADARPSARAVLMKGIDDEGLVFYTNLASRKSEELRVNPRAAATFVWIPLHRQVRFEGRMTMVTGEDADLYFDARPRGAQIAAHASPQSQIVASREELDRAFEELDVKFKGVKVPRPRAWGGWRLSPESVEFWQGQPNRFHDRIRYVRDGAGWRKERLAP
ncbi:MAG TPA: pyridoxamine 5'-phosphate oxidase [Acidimicrobiia bacterium]|nr:pyridoxamine 5'-phosphate oxidase [Acidimicrobiia bacterium]